jgi:hypothetical protein
MMNQGWIGPNRADTSEISSPLLMRTLHYIFYKAL